MGESKIINPNFIITHGFLNSIIHDFQNQDFYIVNQNNGLDINLLNFKKFTLNVPTKTKKHFKEIDFNYFSPFLIENCIIDYSIDCKYNYLCDTLYGTHFIIKISDEMNINELFYLCDIFCGFIITIYFSIELNQLSSTELFELTQKFYNIEAIYFQRTTLFNKIELLNRTLIYPLISAEKHKFDKTISSFQSNKVLYSESHSCHTFYNRKLYIGSNGEIKNAPECDTLSNLKDLNSKEDLKIIISTAAFQKYWFVHKDLCDVCKHCEFRHMCVDNRIPFERTENEWYHKKECNYNPFIAKWEGEQGYRTLEQCGVVTNEDIFAIDQDRIKQINLELWGEL